MYKNIAKYNFRETNCELHKANGLYSSKWKRIRPEPTIQKAYVSAKDCVIIWFGHTAALCKWGDQYPMMEIHSSLQRKRTHALPSGACSFIWRYYDETQASILDKKYSHRRPIVGYCGLSAL